MSRPYFFFLSFKRFIHPSSQTCPDFFLSFFIREGKNETGRSRKGSGRGWRGEGVLGVGGVVFGFWVRKQMKALFFHKGTEANYTQCHTGTPAATLSTWKSTWSGFYCSHLTLSHKNTHTYTLRLLFPSFSLPSTSHLHPPIPPCALCCPLYPIPLILMCDREWITAGERGNCPFTPLDWQRHRLLLSAHWSYHYSNLTKYECTLSCVMLQRFLFILAVRTKQRKRHEHAEIH